MYVRTYVENLTRKVFMQMYVLISLRTLLDSIFCRLTLNVTDVTATCHAFASGSNTLQSNFTVSSEPMFFPSVLFLFAWDWIASNFHAI